MESAQAKPDFVECLDRHRGILFGVARAYCRDVSQREDLVSETIAQLWRAYPRYDGRASIATWIYRIALNVAISFYRTEQRRKSRVVSAEASLVESIPSPETNSERDDRLDLVYEIVERLDPLDRALMLLYLDDNPYATIADVLGISVTNVATKIGRVKERLKREIVAPLANERQTHGTR